MKTFTSIDLQKQTGDVQRAASREGAVITSHGKPRNVILSVEEFCRLKRIAQERIPSGLLSRTPTVIRHAPDPIGYDVRELAAAADRMSHDAINAINADAVDRELDTIRNLFRGKAE